MALIDSVKSGNSGKLEGKSSDAKKENWVGKTEMKRKGRWKRTVHYFPGKAMPFWTYLRNYALIPVKKGRSSIRANVAFNRVSGPRDNVYPVASLGWATNPRKLTISLLFLTACTSFFQVNPFPPFRFSVGISRPCFFYKSNRSPVTRNPADEEKFLFPIFPFFLQFFLLFLVCRIS